MATTFFWIGYHFEEFRSQMTIRKKKLISCPVSSSFSQEKWLNRNGLQGLSLKCWSVCIKLPLLILPFTKTWQSDPALEWGIWTQFPLLPSPKFGQPRDCLRKKLSLQIDLPEALNGLRKKDLHPLFLELDLNPPFQYCFPNRWRKLHYQGIILTCTSLSTHRPLDFPV